VYVEQPPGFVDLTHPDFVFKLENALYDLKQALRTWYKNLIVFLLKIVLLKAKLIPCLQSMLMIS